MKERVAMPPGRVALWLLAPVLLLTLIIHRKQGTTSGASLFFAVALSLMVVAGFCLLWQLPIVYMFGAGLVLSIFSGNWQSIGLPGFPFLPDRFLLMGALLMLALRASDIRDRLRELRITPVHLLLALTVLYATVSAAADGSLGNRDTTFALLDRLGAIPFLMLLVVPLIVRTENERRVLLMILVALGFYLGVEALLEAIGVNALVFPHYIVNPSIGTVDGRVRGPFTSPVTEGFALFGCATAAAVALATKPPRVIRLIAPPVIVMCLLGCFFTLERGVWLGTVVSVFAVGLLTRELRRRLLPALIIAAVGVGGALAFVPGLQHRATQRSQNILSVWDRQNQDAAALRMIEARPLFGFGWSTFPKDGLPYFRQASSYPMTGYGIELHNVYLSNAVELGLVGFLLWLLAQIFAFGSAFTGRAPPELRPWRVGLLGMVTFTAVVAVFNPLEQNFAGLLLWTWAGVTVGGSLSYANRSRTAVIT